METIFSLSSTTKAIIGSPDAIHLVEQKERLERAVLSNDPALTLDSAKALLESTFKTIIADRDSEFDLSKDMPNLYKAVKELVTFNQDGGVKDILEKLLGCIHNWIIQLRNGYGAASHGDDGYFENPVDMIEAELIAYLADAMVGFLYAKHKQDGNPELLARIYYNDYPEFNDYFDAQQANGYSLNLGSEVRYEVSPSQILFHTDIEMYREILLQFLSSEKEDIVENEGENSIEDGALLIPPGQITEKDQAEVAIDEDVIEVENNLYELLEKSIDSEDDIQTERIYHIEEKLKKVLIKSLIVDWYKRDDIRAQIKNSARVLLRREGLSAITQEKVMDRIIEVLKKAYPETLS